MKADSNQRVLWTPSASQVAGAQLTGFTNYFSNRLNLSQLDDYAQLHNASITSSGTFWRSVWEYCGLVGQLGEVDFVPGENIRSGNWFPEAELNFAANLLHPELLHLSSFATAPAIIASNESGRQATWTRQELFQDVRQFASYLFQYGIVAGDRIVGVLPNVGETLIAMLAAASLGAVWSTCSPDFGDAAICDRFGQIQPKILITTLQTRYNHKQVRPLDRVLQLLVRLPTVERVVVIGLDDPTNIHARNSKPESASRVPVIAWRAALDDGCHALLDDSVTCFESAFLRPLPFRQPLYVVYSSGTTGMPKCIVHSAGGSLIQHVKEHRLHCDLRPLDRLFYYTTTGWMMWNWLATGLASQATLVLYDGSPFVHGPQTLWSLAAQTKVTHFGAGARYYSTIEKQGYCPRDHWGLQDIRCVLSTGSPLLEPTFDWIYRAVSSDINLASISGGTDLLSCFVLGNPTLPVRSGEIQCKGLGMDVHVFDEHGVKIVDKPGELVCTSPFPSMPIEFWNDANGKKYQNAYFDRFPNCWCHGDWVKETIGGGFIVYGRSDATLNPGGVRIGTAEIYQQLESFSEVAECLATGWRWNGDEQIVLFIRMASGYDFNQVLTDTIRQRLRTHCSPRHVPDFIAAVPDLPRTISGKLSEIAVRNAISGTSLGNDAALANPESLVFFENWKPGKSLNNQP